MKVLELSGVVDANEEFYEDDGNGDSWYLDNIEGPKIGDTYIVAAFNEAFPPYEYRDRVLTVLLAHGGDKSIYEGTAWAMEGDHGYSSWTPGSGPDMWVGGVEGGRSTDLIDVLTKLDGQTVHLRIDDGPALP